MSDFPPRPDAVAALEMRRRQRGRNVALLVALGGLAALFFALTIVKMGHLG